MEYENLDEELAILLKNLGVNFGGKLLPREKASFRSRDDDYRKYYNNSSSRIVADAFREEIKLLNYRF